MLTKLNPNKSPRDNPSHKNKKKGTEKKENSVSVEKYTESYIQYVLVTICAENLYILLPVLSLGNARQVL